MITPKTTPSGIIAFLLACLVLPLISGCKPKVQQSPPPFDVRMPIQDFDLQGFIDTKLASGEKDIVVPPGRYRVAPKKKVHLTLQDLDEVTINATGVEMICTETTQAMAISNCKNLTLRGLTIDYDPLPFTQGRIDALAPDKSWIEFELLGGYPENLVERIEIFDRQTELLKRGSHYGWKPFENLGNRRYRISKGDSYRYNPDIDREEVGDIIITNSQTAPGGSAPHGIVSSRCKNLILEDVTLFACNCFSFLETYCENTTYVRCGIIPCPPELDLQARSHRRIRSGNADAFHSKHAVRGPQLIACKARFQGDDCVNICGEYYMAMGSSGTRVRILAPKEVNIQPGDPVELVSYTGERLPDAKAVQIENDEPVRPEEIAFIKEQKMNANTQKTLSTEGTRALKITLDREVSLPMGSVIASMNHTGNGFLVEDCDFGFNRSRGILIKASNGKVIGNRVTSSKMAAVLVAPEWWWLESGSSNNIEISGNTIKDCGATAIEVIAKAGNGSTAPAGAHRKITIQGNVISNSPLPAIEVTSTDGLVLSSNQILNPLGSASTTPAAKTIDLINCQNVKQDVP